MFHGGNFASDFVANEIMLGVLASKSWPVEDFFPQEATERSESHKTVTFSCVL